MRRFRFLAAAAAPVSFVVVVGSARAQEATTQIGFVAAVGEGTVLVSNVPIGQPGGRMMMIQKEGAAGESKGGEAQATFTMKHEEGGRQGSRGRESRSRPRARGR